MMIPRLASLLLLQQLLPGFLSPVAAQTSLSAAIAELPKCAVLCLEEALEQSTCAATNTTCICTTASLLNSVTLCVEETCTIKESLVTKNVTMTTCGSPVRDKSGLYSRITIAFGVISAVFVVARLIYKAVFTISDLGMDDHAILLTLCSGIPSTIIGVRMVAHFGLGRDIWTLTPRYITNFVRAFYIMEVLYFFQVSMLKLSMLFFYKRIFPSKNVQLVIWGTVVFDVAFGIIFVILAIFQCHPVSYYWTRWDGEHHGHCLDINSIAWANAAISIALDVWMIAIPLSQLRKLKMHWRKKIAVALMFCVGTFVTIVSIIRLSSLVHFANSENATWDEWDVTNWSTIEINVGIICACMPAMRVMLVRFFPKILGSSINTGKQYYISSKNRSRSRSNAVQLASFENSQDHKAIIRSTSYAVQYGDHDRENDEVRLVQMDDLVPGKVASSKSECVSTSL